MVRETGGWRDLEVEAPDLAQLGATRLHAVRVAMLGTLRSDGSPRISPIEPYFVEHQLLIGGMAWSKKVADLRRDPRYVLHSAITAPDSGEGELKVYGTAAEVGDDLRASAIDAWWAAWPADKAVVLSLHIAQAVFIDWDIEDGLMTVHRWSPQGGYMHTSRTYP